MSPCPEKPPPSRRPGFRLETPALLPGPPHHGLDVLGHLLAGYCSRPFGNQTTRRWVARPAAETLRHPSWGSFAWPTTELRLPVTLAALQGAEGVQPRAALTPQPLCREGSSCSFQNDHRTQLRTRSCHSGATVPAALTRSLRLVVPTQRGRCLQPFPARPGLARRWGPPTSSHTLFSFLSAKG